LFVNLKLLVTLLCSSTAFKRGMYSSVRLRWFKPKTMNLTINDTMSEDADYVAKLVSAFDLY